MIPDQRHEAARKRVQYDLPGASAVRIERGVAYRSGSDSHTLDIYYPPDRDTPVPAVLLITGLSDLGAIRMLGCRISEMESYVSWARLIAASGLVAITYTTDKDPTDDTAAVLQYVRTDGHRLGIDHTRIALHATSSHVPNALGQIVNHGDRITSALLCYGFMLDLDREKGVAGAQKTWRFVNPSAGCSVADLPKNVSFFLVRAGHDQTPGVNPSIDAFVRHTIRENLPVTLVNHATGIHAFDLEDGTAGSRQIVAQMLAFLGISLST